MVTRTIDVIQTKANLAELISNHGSICHVAADLGLSPTAVYRWVSFAYPSIPTLDHIVELASLLGVTLDDIVATKEL